MQSATDPFDEERHSRARESLDPETSLLRDDTAHVIHRVMNGLPDRSRQLLILREVDGLSYRELADVLGIPIGTVMSGLSRARQSFRRSLDAERTRPGRPPTRQPRR